MFGRLLKYDFRSMCKQFGFIWPAALLLAAVNRFTLSGLDANGSLEETIAGIAMLVYIAILMAMFVISVIFVIQRFFKGLLGDEGYLMHTLPVRPWELIGSKLICAVVMTLISIVVAILSIFIIVLPGNFHEFAREFFGMFSWLWSNFDGDVFNAILAFAEILLLLLTGMAQGYVMLYLAMAIGHLFHKNRVAMSVIAYIGIHAVMSTCFSMLGHLFWDMIHGFVQRFFWGPVGWRDIHQSLWITILCTAAISALYFFFTDYILRNKLNLE